MAGAAPDAAESKQTRATMGEIVQALEELLPASLDDQRFSDPTRRDAILAALTKLATSGARLEAHGRERDAGFGFLSRSLARDTEEIRQRYADGRTDEARFLLHEVTQDCVACHSRLPSQRDASLGRRLMAEERVAALPLEERARLEFATRQFERAEATLEALLASPERTANDLDLGGALDEYLELCLRVRRDYQRPVRTLERFAARADVSPRLRAQIERWIASLRDITARKRAVAPLDEAQALLAVAQDRARFPEARDAIVYDLVASGELHRFVEATPAGPEAALAYYRLGQIESRIGRSFWLSQTEAFLETAIRMAPGEPFAPQALDQLQEFLISGYTGSGGRHVPADVQIRLAELRGLVEAAQPAAEIAPSPERQVEPPATR
jgi:tetratricopeptide (TPR) repeat protein